MPTATSSSSACPAAEHALFERYAQAAQQVGERTGAVTVPITHRFSTVQMATIIVVLDRGPVVEVGDHQTLLASGGLYRAGRR